MWVLPLYCKLFCRAGRRIVLDLALSPDWHSVGCCCSVNCRLPGPCPVNCEFLQRSPDASVADHRRRNNGPLELARAAAGSVVSGRLGTLHRLGRHLRLIRHSFVNRSMRAEGQSRRAPRRRPVAAAPVRRRPPQARRHGADRCVTAAPPE